MTRVIDEPRRLTDYASCGGCAGKIPVEMVARIVSGLPTFDDPNLLVGAEHFSDAGVYRVRDDLAIVNTVDFFPPMVDNPFTFGQIAAANALSDVYAMGAEPKTALNIVAFPDDKAEPDLLHEILRGGADRVRAAGAVIVGGHSLRDSSEIKYGLAVTGLVDPARMLTNARARPGDALVLTKGLGTGFAVSAYRSNQCPEEVLAGACRSMITLNRAAAAAALTLGAHAATDITGFGLAGHALEMAQASAATLCLDIGALPLLSGAASLAEAGHHSRATGTNRRYVEPFMRIEGEPDVTRLHFLFDAQTSGGLLISINADRAHELVRQCHESGLTATGIIGSVEARDDRALVIRP